MVRLYYREESGVDDANDFKVFHKYGDDTTMRIVNAVAKVSGEHHNIITILLHGILYSYSLHDYRIMY